MNGRAFDVIVVGAGMVGAATALAFAQSGMRVALVDAHRQEFRFDPARYDLRVSAITRATENILRSLRVWDDVCAHRVSPFREMHVWDESGSGAIHFDSADIGCDLLGYIVENEVVQGALHGAVRNHAGVAFLAPRVPLRLVSDSHAATLTLQDGDVLQAPLVIGADGRDSWVRGQVGLSYPTTRYEQRSIVANITTALPHRETARQRFTHEGPVAMLPLANGQSSLVWSVPTPRADALMALDDAAFLEALQAAFGDALGALLETSPRAAFDLQRAHAGGYVGPRVALVGDAAHSIHPLAGQGVNMGLLDSAALVQCVVEGRAKGRDVGDLSVLRPFERLRRGHNLAMQTVVAALEKLYVSASPLVVWMRNTGMRATHNARFVKNLITEHAMGLRGDLPASARRV
jgi:2-octaprenylphenol hydroxylase